MISAQKVLIIKGLNSIKTKGFLYFFKKTFEYSYLNTLYRKFLFRKYRHLYSQNIIFIAGFAKSGSTWIANLFSSLPGFSQGTPKKWLTHIDKDWNDFTATNLSDQIFNKFHSQLTVVKSHTWGFEQNRDVLRSLGGKFVLTVRDPRDKLISAFYYAKNNSNHWDHKNTQGSLEEYLQYKLKSGEFNVQSLNWLRSWKETIINNEAIIIKYEDLLDDPLEVFRSSLSQLNISLDDQQIEQILDKHNFKKLSNKGSFYRKGVHGEWKQIFNDELKKMFRDQGEDVIEFLNYQPTI